MPSKNVHLEQRKIFGLAKDEKLVFLARVEGSLIVCITSTYKGDGQAKEHINPEDLRMYTGPEGALGLVNIEKAWRNEDEWMVAAGEIEIFRQKKDYSFKNIGEEKSLYEILEDLIS